MTVTRAEFEAFVHAYKGDWKDFQQAWLNHRKQGKTEKPAHEKYDLPTEGMNKFIEGLNKQVSDGINRWFNSLDPEEYDKTKIEFYGPSLVKPVIVELFPRPAKRDPFTVTVSIPKKKPKPTCPQGSFWSDDYGLCVPDGVDPHDYALYVARQYKYPLPLPRHGDPAGFPAPRYTFIQQPNKGWRPRKPSPPDKDDPEYSEARCPPGFGYNPIHDLCVPNGMPVQDWLDYLKKMGKDPQASA